MTNEATTFNIPSLDGLRAVSIGIVFASHAGLDHIVPGGFGVTVFFVISGYLITTLMRREDDRSGHISVRDFYIRRVFRILPLFYFVLAATACATVWFGLGTGTVDRGPFIAQLLHVSNYWAILEPSRPFMQGTGVYWSLAIEEHYYLLFPWVYLLLRRLGLTNTQRAGALIGMCGAVLLARIVLVTGAGVPEARTYYGTDTRIDAILVGCALGLLHNPAIDPAVSRRRLRVAAIGATLTILVTLVIRDMQFRETFRYSLQSFAVVPIIMYVVTEPSSIAGRLLNAGPIAWLGRLSYAFYLVHFVILIEFQKHLGAVSAAAGALATTIAVSLALHHLIERPANRLRTLVLRGRPPHISPGGTLDPAT